MTDQSGGKQAGGRKWRPGESGNPKGRPPGSGAAAKVRAAIAEDVPEIIKRLAESAKAGDVQAARVLLDRVVPALRAESISVQVPGLDTGTLTERAEGVLTALASGNMPPDLGAHLLAALSALAGLREADEIESRLAALEAQLAKTN